MNKRLRKPMCFVLVLCVVFIIAICETVSASKGEENPGKNTMKEIFDKMEQRAEEYAPKVITLDNGVMVQRTPSDIGGYWHRPGNTTSYNTYYLNADNRGCLSCHNDLIDLLKNSEYSHLDFSNTYGLEMEVQDCMICHNQGDGYLVKTQEFGSLIHGIHSKNPVGDKCMTCHNATSDGRGLILWEEAKYDVLQGITFLPDVQGEFSYDQNKLTDTEGILNVNWMSSDTNYAFAGAELADLPLDPDLFDNWTISITGEVKNPFTLTLKELVETMPSERRIMTQHCIMNPVGGPYISNCEITGISISSLLQKAGIVEGATAVMSYAPDGWNRGILLEKLLVNDAYLVYELNGERLGWGQGYPLSTWDAGGAAPSHIRRVTELRVVNTPPENVKIFDGWYYEGEYVNKPSVGIFQFHEGQIIPAGQQHVFEGYANAFDEQVIAVDFSLDRGKTWTRFSTEESDLTKWIYWNFKYTPEKPGAYVLSVRAETASGLVTITPEEIMFNAK
ncbi:MAG: molybdopterin-dependent oxidoreductase [Christensenellales bacterium]